jgi:serine/threonine-protein kinase
MKRIGRRLASALALTLVVVTAACGGGDDDNSAATQTTKAQNDTAVDGTDDSVAEAITALESDPDVQEFAALGEKRETYVGKVEGSDAYIALVDNGAGVITAYVCDGSKVGAWAEGERTGDTVSASGASGLQVDATVSGSSVSGNVVVPGWGSHAFSASLATRPAGLWQPIDTETGKFAGLKVGWIVLEDESQRGLALTSQKNLEIVEPVNTASGAAGSSTGVVTTGKTLTTECQGIQNLYNRGISTALSNPSGSELQKKGTALWKQAEVLWANAGCPAGGPTWV